MASLIQFFVWIIGLIIFVWAIGAAWNRWWWAKDGRPKLTEAEQLGIDLLRARGFTKTAARRKIIEERNSDLMSQITAIRETEDLLFNPDREDELRELMKRNR